MTPKTNRKKSVLSPDETIEDGQAAERRKADFSRIVELFKTFCASDFDVRKITVETVSEYLRSETDQTVSNLMRQIKSALLNEHIRLTVKEVRVKYAISGKPGEKDFYRICEGEGIVVVNSENATQTKQIKIACYFVKRDTPNQYFLNFDEQLTGKNRLRCQFHLLGYHFLHRTNLLPIKEIFEAADPRKEEAALFAIQFVDFKPEVKR